MTMSQQKGRAVTRILGANSIYAFSRDNRPAIRARPPAELIFETQDCFGGQVTPSSPALGTVDWGHINPATGPVYVEGAKPGDVLAVRVQSIEVAGLGLMAAMRGEGVLAGQVRATEVKFVPVARGRAKFNDRVELPVKPMIGVIGVAPAGEPVPCGTPGSHGGNMDTRIIGPGATVLFPVAVDGALLAMGDVHAVMGDGEVMGTGVEVAAEISVRVGLRRDLADLELRNPLIVTDSVLAAVASAKTLDAAVKAATRGLAGILMKRAKLSLNDAGMLCSAAGTVAVSQVVDPLKTARFEFPLNVLRDLGVVI